MHLYTQSWTDYQYLERLTHCTVMNSWKKREREEKKKEKQGEREREN